ncbi:MAG: hypothetical protein AB7O49_06475 [Sphingomonadales bacterium]
MTFVKNIDTRREAVAVFRSAEHLECAIDELLSSGFDRAELSLLAAQDAVEEKLGHHYQKVAELEDDMAVPRTCYVSTGARGDAEGALMGGLLYVGAVAAAGLVLASGGTLAAALATAAVSGGTGGAIGAVLAWLVGEHHAEYLQEQLDRGGLLLWVQLRDDDHERAALRILDKHSGRDVHAHAVHTIGK